MTPRLTAWSQGFAAMINETHLQAIDVLADSFHSFTAHPNISHLPYPLVRLPSFLTASAFERVRRALSELAFRRRHSDLYEFEQTVDLKHVAHPVIRELCTELYSERFVQAISRIVGRPLSTTNVDISGQRYRRGNFLLCHDDRLDSRRVAMMIYLTDEGEWRESYGGLLERLGTDHRGHALLDGRHSALSSPDSNTAAFFEVTAFSYHQVTLMRDSAPDRLSITLWFHDQPGVGLMPSASAIPIRFPSDGWQQAFTASHRHCYQPANFSKLMHSIPHGLVAGKPLFCLYGPSSYASEEACSKFVCLLSSDVPVSGFERLRWAYATSWSIDGRVNGSVKTIEIPVTRTSEDAIADLLLLPELILDDNDGQVSVEQSAFAKPRLLNELENKK